MEVYTTDNDGYITDTKDVGDDCEISENDFIGEAPFKINHHHETGLKRPLTQEQIYEQEKAKALSDLREIDDLILLGMKTEQDKLDRQTEWLTYHNEYIVSQEQ